MEVSVNMLAKKLRELDFFHTLIMVPMPRTRNAMHLDTIFTRVSENECLVYPPMILPVHRPLRGTSTCNILEVKKNNYLARFPTLMF